MSKVISRTNRSIINNVTYRGTINFRRTEMWPLVLNKKSNINLTSSLVMSVTLLRRMTSDLTIVFTQNPSLDNTNYVYKLNNKTTFINNNFVLEKGTWYIKFSYPLNFNVSYAYKLVITDYIEPPAPVVIAPIQEIKKYALVVSISDYLYINDLSYCDEDAVAWCNFLTSNGYEVILLGDKTSVYDKYKLTDYATEANIRKYMKIISDKVKENDKFVFASSGHGSGDGLGSSFLCCLDQDYARNGQYMDTELGEDVKLFTDKKCKVILFFDNCNSGGLISECISNDANNVCATSTCGAAGYGFDVTQYKHGAWTYHFLVKSLLQNPKGTVNQVYTNAIIGYPYTGVHRPELGGNGSLTF